MYAKKVLLVFGIPAFLLCSLSAFAGNWKSQGAGDDDALGKAASNYQLYCSMCHGRDGDGKGEIAPTLSVPPRDHTDASKMSKRTDEQIFKTISEGGEATGFDSGMPPHNTILQVEEIRGLVKFVRKLCNCTYSGK